MLRNLWNVNYSTPFVIRMQLAKTYLISVLLYGCEILANCDCDDNRILNLAFNNIDRYIFHRGRHDHISHLAYQILSIKCDNLLKMKCRILLYKMIYTKQPKYLFCRIKFARSYRGMKAIQPRFQTHLSQRQFFIHTISLWKSLPNLGNGNALKKELFKSFSYL